MTVVPLLLLKLTLTPLLIGGASLAARRWGPAVAGWLVALPLTSGPVLFFVALDHGPEFASEAAIGTTLGLAAIAAYSLAFAAGSNRGPATAVAAAALAYVVAGLGLRAVVDWPYLLLAGLVVASIFAALALIPAGSGGRSGAPHPAWDLPARLVVGTGLVVGLTTIAPLLGPATSGIVTTFPVYITVLSAFAFLHDGRPGGIGVIRGSLIGLPGTVAFYVPVHFLLVPMGVVPAFALSLVVTAAYGTLALPRVRAASAPADTLDAELV